MYLFHLYSSFQVNLKRITNLKTVKGVEIFIILNLYQDLLKLFFSFLYLSNKVIFVFGSEHLGAPPRRRVSPAWQRFNFTVLKMPLSFPLQGFNPDALPTVFKSQHSLLMSSHGKKFMTTIWIIRIHAVYYWDLWEVAEVVAQIIKLQDEGQSFKGPWTHPFQGLHFSSQLQDSFFVLQPCNIITWITLNYNYFKRGNVHFLAIKTEKIKADLCCHALSAVDTRSKRNSPGFSSLDLFFIKRLPLK